MATKNFLKSLKSWTTPAFSERTVMKGAWGIGKRLLKFAWRRPILTTALTYAAGKPFRKYKKAKSRRWGGPHDPTAGKYVMSKGKWLL